MLMFQTKKEQAKCASNNSFVRLARSGEAPLAQKCFIEYLCGNFQPPDDAPEVGMNFCAAKQQEEANKEQSWSGSIPCNCKHSTPETLGLYCLLPNKQDGTDQLNESKDKHEKRERNGSKISSREERHRISSDAIAAQIFTTTYQRKEPLNELIREL